jgi:hypothetical protein
MVGTTDSIPIKQRVIATKPKKAATSGAKKPVK